MTLGFVQTQHHLLAERRYCTALTSGGSVSSEMHQAKYRQVTAEAGLQYALLHGSLNVCVCMRACVCVCVCVCMRARAYVRLEINAAL